jgi:hypothetical protein
MSLFGAKSVTSLKESLKKAKENMQRRESASPSLDTASSGIGAILEQQFDKITGPVSTLDLDGTATSSEIAHEFSQGVREGQLREFHGTAEYEMLKQGEEQDRVEMGLRRARIEDDLRRRENPDATPRQESGWLPSDLNDMRAYSDLTGKTGVTGVTSYRSRSVGSEDRISSVLSSPPPTTRQTTEYGGSIVGFPPSAIPQDPFATPRTSGRSILAARYIQSEENNGEAAESDEEEEGGMPETLKISTPIPRKFECSDSSDEAMMEVEWRDEEPYMTPTKKGKKRNKGKGVKRPVTPERPIPNTPQTPSRKKLEADWAKPAEVATNEKGVVDLEAFVGEYLWNTNGLRDFMATNQLHDERYDEWCLKQAEHMAARQNHTDAGVTSTRKTAAKVLTEVQLSREYDEARADKLDQRLEKIEKKVAKLAPVNMAKTIENAMSACMEKMVDQLTDRVVKRFEDMAEESRKKDEIRRGKQVEATPEEE